MSTATGTLTVNAAFLQEIKDDNRELHSLLDRCHEALTHPGGDRPLRKAVELLTRLRDQVALHFSLEEAYGYFENAIDVPPRLSEQAETLRSQHGPLFVEICEIVDLADRTWRKHPDSEDLRRIAAAYEAFCQHLRDHEAHETDLILAAANDDIGVGD
jgi:hypothetical protein